MRDGRIPARMGSGAIAATKLLLVPILVSLILMAPLPSQGYPAHTHEGGATVTTSQHHMGFLSESPPGGERSVRAGFASQSPRWIPSVTGFTYDPFNGSLIQGEYATPEPGYPIAALDIPSLGDFVLGDSEGGYAYVINASTGHEERAIHAGNSPQSLAFDWSSGVLYSALGGGADNAISFSNPVTGVVGRTLRGIANVGDLIYDPSGNLLILSNWTGVRLLNASTGANLSYIPVHWGVLPLALNPLDGTLLVADPANSTVYVVNLTQSDVAAHFSTVVGGAGYAPNAFLYDPAVKTIFSANGDGTTSVINARTNRLNGTNPIIRVGGNSLALDSARHTVYVGSCGDGAQVCEFYDTNGTVVNTTLPAGATDWVAYDPGTGHLIVYSVGSAATVYNTLTDSEVTHTIMLKAYLGGAYDSSNGRIYIATPAAGGVCSLAGSVTVLNPAVHPSALASVPTGDGPSQVAYDVRDDRVFVTNYCGNSVTVVDATNDSVVRQNLPVGSEPYGVLYDPASDTVVVANYNSGNLTLVNGSTLATVATVPLPLSYPYGLAWDSANNTVFVSEMGGHSLIALNATSYAIEGAPVPVGTSPLGILYDPENNMVYVADGGSNNISVVNASTRAVVSLIGTVAGTGALALDPLDHLLFATDPGGSRVVVVDTLNQTAETPTLPASGEPQGVIYDPASGQVYVPNFGTGAVNLLANAAIVDSLIATPSPAEVGVPMTLSASIDGGTAPVHLQYTGLPVGCYSADTVQLVCTPTRSGTYDVQLATTDALGYSWAANLTLTVNPRLAQGALAASPASFDLGMATTLSLTAPGGTPPLRYTYSGLPGGCSSANVSSISCTPNDTGSFSIVGVITDSSGVVAVGGAELQVNALPRVASLTAAPNPVLVNATLLIATSAVGGTGPLSYSYSGLPPGCTPANQTLLTCVPSAPGEYTLSVSIMDVVGSHASAAVLSSVQAPPPPAPVPPPAVSAFYADPATVTAGGSVSLYAVIQDGMNPLTFTWSGLPKGCAPLSTTASSLTCRPPDVGNYVVGLNVTDALGRAASASTSLVVAAAPNTTPVGQSPGIPANLLVVAALSAGVIGGGAGGAVGYLLSRRRPPDSKAGATHRPDSGALRP